MTEKMAREGEDYIECPCGNASHLDGFYCAAPSGASREGEYGPTAEWDGDTMVCLACGRVFSLTTGLVADRRATEDQRTAVWA